MYGMAEGGVRGENSRQVVAVQAGAWQAAGACSARHAVRIAARCRAAARGTWRVMYTRSGAYAGAARVYVTEGNELS